MNFSFRLFAHILRVLVLLGVAATTVVPALWAEDLQVQPGRIFLGSLTYGGETGQKLHKSVVITHPDPAWKVARVDLSQAPGIEARWERLNPSQVRVNLDIDLDRFVEGQPYGALVKRLVRVETSLPDVSQVLISITGMTSQNATERNFSDFRYQGRTRWQGEWATPNIAGSVLAVAGVFAAGVLAWFGGPYALRRNKLFLFGCVFAGGMVLACLVGLVLTYSRGAWVACGTGLVLLFVLMRGCRRPLLAIGVVWGLLIIALPEGLSRAGSSLQMQEDKSIRHRLQVWEGALQMMAEHPWTGVGPDQFGKIFPLLYQKPCHKDGYSTAISDWLTWAAERGVVVVGLGTGLTWFLLLWGVARAWKHPDMATAPFTAALSTLAVASGFSTLGFVREVQGFWIFLVLVLAGMVIREKRKTWTSRGRDVPYAPKDVRSCGQQAWDTSGKRQTRHSLAIAGACCLTACLLWWSAGRWALGRLPTRTVAISSPAGKIWVAQPRQEHPKGLVWYFSNEREDEATLLRTTIRPLAALGWTVAVLSAQDPVPDGTALLSMEKSIGGTGTGPCHLAGHREGAVLALRTALQYKGRVPIHSVSIFGLVSPATMREVWMAWGKDAPLLRVMHSKWDDQAPIDPVARWIGGLKSAGCPVITCWQEEAVARHSTSWQAWVRFVAGNGEEAGCGP